MTYALCGFDEGLHRQFSDAYTAAAPKKNRRALKRCSPLYQAYVLLEIAWHFNKKLKQASFPNPLVPPVPAAAAALLSSLPQSCRKILEGICMLSLIIPLYNEEALVDELIARSSAALQSATEDYEILCIDDGSSDRTLEKLLCHHERDSRVK